MKVILKPSSLTIERHPYGDGYAEEPLVTPATATIRFDTVREMTDALRAWAAGEPAASYFGLDDPASEDTGEPGSVRPENIVAIRG